MQYVGREFTPGEIDRIRGLIAQGLNRTAISRAFCEAVNWRKPDGGLKEMSCRVALLKMHRDSHVALPPPQRPANNDRKKPAHTHFTNPEVVETPSTLSIERAEGTLWNEYIDRYHYLG